MKTGLLIVAGMVLNTAMMIVGILLLRPILLPQPTPAPVVDNLAALEAIDFAGDDGARLAAYHRAFAEFLPHVKTTSDVRQANSIAGRVMFGAEIDGKYPTLETTLNGLTVDAIGTDPRELTSADRDKLAALYDQIAGAVE